MKKIIFTHSYFLRYDPKQWALGQPYAPIGTLHAAALLRRHGFEVIFFDTMFSQSPHELSVFLETNAADCLVIYDDGFNYLTKMCLTNMRQAAFEMMAIGKERQMTVIVSSSDSTDHYEKYLEGGADFVLIGEAEQTLLELCQSLGGVDGRQSSIPGLAFRQENCLVKTVKRNVRTDLDSLPMPAWDLVDMEPYRRLWGKNTGHFSINIGTTRGCPFKCNWCAKPIYGNRYNSRSPEHVIQEILYLQQHFAFDHIWFCDDIFGLKPGWVRKFADLIEGHGIRTRFKIQSRADLLLQNEYVADLARAGCETIWMGAESGSQKILDAMDKGIQVEQIATASALIRKMGMKPCFFIQFGYPGETRADIELTIKMINRLLPHEIGISVSYPLPGTLFYERVKSELKQKTNWTDSDELALMFNNTYQPAFYKQLHRYVHINYRLHVALRNIRQLLSGPAGFTITSLKKILSLAYYLPAGLITRRKLNALERKMIA
jgi:anaerobic magnesium-protoporphyrin IX monomethyl ester cyclase